MAHIELTQSNFKREVLDAEAPVVVDFWAPWCGPCRMLGPAIDELADEYDGRVKVAKLNTDEHPGVAQALRISGVPTVMFFKHGRLVDRSVGAVPKAELRARVERMLRG